METHIFSNYLLPITLALIMLGMGLSLTTRDFRNIFMHPKAVILGLVSQMIVLPLFAILVAQFSGLSDELKVGLVLIAACPGGAVSNLITHLLKGNVALSVSMTTVNSFITIFTIPAIVGIALHYFIGDSKEITLDFWATFIRVLLITVLPCVVGVIIHQQHKLFAESLEKPLKLIMPISLALMMIGSIFLEKKENVVPITFQEYLTVIIPCLILNLGGMFIGFYIAKAFGLIKKNQITIAIEVGLQNTGLAIFVATSLLHNQRMAIPSAVYALFTFFSAAIFGFLVNKEEIMKKPPKSPQHS
jgi:BASS family bile acid:Na+ symporter